MVKYLILLLLLVLVFLTNSVTAIETKIPDVDPDFIEDGSVFYEHSRLGDTYFVNSNKNNMQNPVDLP